MTPYPFGDIEKQRKYGNLHYTSLGFACVN